MSWLGAGIAALVGASGWIFAAIHGRSRANDLIAAERHAADLRIQLADREADLSEIRHVADVRRETEKRLRRALEMTEKERDDAINLLKELRPTGAAGSVFDSIVRRARNRSGAA